MLHFLSFYDCALLYILHASFFFHICIAPALLLARFRLKLSVLFEAVCSVTIVFTFVLDLMSELEILNI